MAILGNEQPVMMPTMQVYDTDLMKAYIAGVKEQYDNARADMKDFMKSYGDFYSPIAGDTENYYNLTLGGANDMLSQMMARGIDPYKSPEARNAIARYIANVPSGKIAQMKQSAENAKQYLQQKAKLQAAGKWNEAYERYLLGGKSLENWDTARDGVWNRVSPSEYSDLFDSTNPWFANMQDSFLESKGGYDYYGVTDKQMRPILDQSMSDFLNTDLGRFHYNQFRNAAKMANPDANEQDIMNNFKNEIMSKNKRVQRVKRDENQYSLASYKNNLEIQAARQKAAIEVEAHRQKAAIDAAKNPNNPSGDRLSWTDAADYSNQGINEYSQNTSDVEAVNYAMRQLVTGQKTVNGKKVVEFKNDEDKKLYYKYGKLINILKKKDKTKDDLNWLQTNGYTDKNGMGTNKYEAIVNQKYYDGVKSKVEKANAHWDINKKIAIADNLFTQHSSMLQGDFQDTARRLFSGSSKSGDKVANIRSGDTNLQFTPVARMKMFGIVYKKTNVGKHRSLFVDFSSMLKSENVPALDSGNSVRVTAPINGYRHISGDVKITYNDFKRIADKMGYAGREQELIEKLGLTSTYTSQEGTKYNVNAYSSRDIRQTTKDHYVYIPMTRSIKQGSYEDSEINNSHQAYMLGKGFASKNMFDPEE